MDILQLNNDVLLEIFSYLGHKDLISASRSCQRFFELFPLCRVGHLSISQIETDDEYMSLADLEYLCQNIGHTVASIKCWNQQENNGVEHTKLFAQYCTTVQSLELRHFQIEALVELIETFKSVESLYLAFMDVEEVIDCLFPCVMTKLKYLRLKNCEFDLNCSVIKAPNLERVKFKYSSLADLDKFFIQSPKIKDFNSTHCYVLNNYWNDLSKLPLLENFVLKSDMQDDISVLSNMKSLKSVRLSGEHINPNRFLEVLCKRDQLTSLKLISTRITIECARRLAQMENLSVFWVTYNDSFGDEHVKALFGNNFKDICLFSVSASSDIVMELAEKSKNLEVLDVGSTFRCRDTFHTLLKKYPNVNIRVPYQFR